MDTDFYKTARRWYNTIYVNPASERLGYFLLFIISLSCLYYAVALINQTLDIKNKKYTYVLSVQNKSKDTYTNVSRLHSLDDSSSISLLKKIIEKYVINMESLVYSDDETGMDAIRKKSIIIDNLSSKNVYDYYMNRSTLDSGDVSLAVLKIQKTVTIDKIEFIYEDLDIFKGLYSNFFLERKPKGAKIYFTTETTEKSNKKKHYVAVMYFNYLFKIKFGSNEESNIDFKVNDYYIDK